MNLKLAKIRQSIIKAASVRHRIVKKSTVNALKEEFLVILINVNVKIAKTLRLNHTPNLKTTKIFTTVPLI